MPASLAVDQDQFRRIIRRNIALPLGVGLLTVAVFVALIAYLVNTMSWAEHSERVIGDANEMLRLAVDRESSMRGFLITGDESFLAPYELGQPRFEAEIRRVLGEKPPLSVKDLAVGGGDVILAAVVAGVLPEGSRGGPVPGHEILSSGRLMDDGNHT